MQKKKKITVVDSYMGSGKTSWAIQYMQDNAKERKFIFITPFLDETKRIEEQCPDLDFKMPDVKKGRGRKMNHLLELIQQGENISSTHSLFSNISDEVVELLRAAGYTLILDEAFQVLEGFDMWKGEYSRAGDDFKAELTKRNIQTLVKKEFITIEENFRVNWIDQESSLDKYALLKRLADRGLLYAIRGSLLLWSFPTEVFDFGIFEDVFVLTYQFEFQLQHFYYSFFGIEYEKFGVKKSPTGKYELFPWGDGSHDSVFRERVKNKIRLVDSDKMNRIGNPYVDSAHRNRNSTLSRSWYNRFSETMMPLIHSNMTNFFGNVAKSTASERMWTCFSGDISDFRTKNVNPKHWVPLNSRATNKYRRKTSLAYMVNRYLNPYYEVFFSSRGIKLNQDGYALSEMMQWIWRSAIRDDKCIDLYIPSWRMRSLLIAYLDGRDLETIYDN